MQQLRVLSVVAAVACGGSSEPSGVHQPPPTASALVGPSVFNGTGTETFKAEFRVLNANNDGVPGIVVTFEASGGTLSAKSVVTNAAGTAAVDWTPPNISSVQTLTALVPNTTLRASVFARVTRSLVGRWLGSVNGASFDLTVTSQTIDTVNADVIVAQLAGRVTYRSTASSAPIVLDILFGHAFWGGFSITAGLNSAAYTFGGEVRNNETALVGYINGGEFADTPITMTRQ